MTRSVDYIPTTDEQKQYMLQQIGVASTEELFEDIPQGLRFQGRLNLPPGLHEPELLRHMRELAAKNRHLDELVCFGGGGAYDHVIPAAVGTIISRSEFYTSYTPYQAEITQGVLQTIFEFQTLICQLTGLDIANASVYDGASACAEGMIMACSHTGRSRVLVAETVHPEYRLVVETYLRHQGITVETVPAKDGLVDAAILRQMLGDDVAGFLAQQPNFYGHLEPVREASDAVHRAGGLFVVAVDPLSLGILEPPGAYGADIAVGEGQSMGNPLSFGGPYLGFLAAKEALIRRIPGRIVGETVDNQGRRGFVLTLQAREQHIRRHRATSNICTNQALNALAASAYLALVGKEGLREAALLSFQKAHYLARRLEEIDGVRRPWRQPFFKEFVIETPLSADELQARLVEAGFFAGPTFSQVGLEPERALIVCATEARTRDEIDRFVEATAASLSRRRNG